MINIIFYQNVYRNLNMRNQFNNLKQKKYKNKTKKI